MEIDIKEYYTRYGPMVFRRCRQLLKDEETALDAMQEVFVKLLIHKGRLKGTYPSSLLFRISTNICLNIIRDQRKQVSLDKDKVLNEIAHYENSEKRVIIHDMLQKIFHHEKESTREIAVMKYLDGMTLQEIADEVGLSLSGVRKRLRRLQTQAKTKKEIYNDSPSC
ncbi:MAG: sigma-70 family RNA polymerase sigma factor [Candidatus Aminicenantes bacterium]|nr:sigma-70 family RNA polymerase sigma factor [Candidatus Aminicenantes bacterium]